MRPILSIPSTSYLLFPPSMVTMIFLKESFRERYGRLSLFSTSPSMRYADCMYTLSLPRLATKSTSHPILSRLPSEAWVLYIDPTSTS